MGESKVLRKLSDQGNSEASRVITESFEREKSFISMGNSIDRLPSRIGEHLPDLDSSFFDSVIE